MLPLSLNAQLSKLDDEFDDDFFDEIDSGLALASQINKPIAPPTRADTRSIATAKRDVDTGSTTVDASESESQTDITFTAPDLKPSEAEIMYKQLDSENKELKREHTKQQDRMRLAENKLATATARHNHELAMAKKQHMNITTELEEKLKALQMEVERQNSNFAFLQQELEITNRESKSGASKVSHQRPRSTSITNVPRENDNPRKRKIAEADEWGAMLPKRAARVATVDLNEEEEADFPDLDGPRFNKSARPTMADKRNNSNRQGNGNGHKRTSSKKENDTIDLIEDIEMDFDDIDIVPRAETRPTVAPKAATVFQATNESSWKHVQSTRYADIVAEYFYTKQKIPQGEIVAEMPALPFYLQDDNTLDGVIKTMKDALLDNINNLNHFDMAQPFHYLREANLNVEVLNNIYTSIVAPGTHQIPAADITVLCEWVIKCRLLEDTRPLWQVDQNIIPEVTEEKSRKKSSRARRAAARKRGIKPDWMTFDSCIAEKSFRTSSNFQADICYNMYATACHVVRFLRNYVNLQYNEWTRGTPREKDVTSLVKMCVFLNNLSIATLRCDSMDILCTIVTEFNPDPEVTESLETKHKIAPFNSKLTSPKDRFYCVGFDLNVKGYYDEMRSPSEPLIPWSKILNELEGELVAPPRKFQILASRKVMRLFYLLWKTDFALSTISDPAYAEMWMFSEVVETLTRSLDNYSDPQLSKDCIRVLSLLKDDGIPKLTRRLFLSCLSRLQDIGIPELHTVAAMA
ncbi:hypothetical protein CJU90_2384 [Yarrowia sp. C11]|nr:hypothetical protein CKK34_6411 [Yarrowia sp. E02]KAG5372298.1 hypothetical protein CJU90_2384 [Yarrowia sp. C11]